jgi:hypothetical protein
MCLMLNEDSARLKRNLRRRKKPITVYKALFDFGEDGIFSEYKDFQWKEGLNTSNRDRTVLFTGERRRAQVSEGFHFFLNQEEAEEYCRYPYRCQYLYPYRYQYLYPYRCLSRCPCRCRYPDEQKCPYFKVVKLTIQPKDMVAVGEFDNKQCVVATKATMLTEKQI